MKIVRNNKYMFKDIMVGDVFKFETEIYMKIEPFEHDLEERNAINLSTALCTSFDDYEDVFKLNAKLLIEY